MRLRHMEARVSRIAWLSSCDTLSVRRTRAMRCFHVRPGLTSFSLRSAGAQLVCRRLEQRCFWTTNEPQPPKKMPPQGPMLPEELSALGFKFLVEDELKRIFDEADSKGSGRLEVDDVAGLLQKAGASERDALEAAGRVAAELQGGAVGGPAVAVSWESFHAAVDKAAQPVDKRIWPISFSLSLHFLSLGTMAPCMPLLARDLGLSHSQLGMVTSASALARIALNIPFATLAEQVGRRPFLIAGPAFGAVSMTCIGLSGTFPQLVACSAASGIGGTMIMTGAGLYLNDIATPRNRARTTAPLMMTAIMGFAAGPALGGLLAQSYGLQAPFFVCAGGMTLASLSALAQLPETKRETIGAKEGLSTVQQWRKLMGRPALQGIIAQVVSSGFANGAAPVSVVLFASEILNMSPSMIGLMFTAQVLAMGVCIQPATKLSDKVAAMKSSSRLRVMMPGMLTSAFALSLQSQCWTPEMFIGAGVLASMGNAFVMPNVSAYIMDNTKQDERAQALAMQRMAQDVGLLMGASSMGLVASTYGVATAMVTTATLQATAAIFCAVRSGAYSVIPVKDSPKAA